MKYLTLLSLLVLSVQQVSANCTWNKNTWIEYDKPDGIYADNLDGTITDTETGLMWSKCLVGQTWNAGANASDGSDDSCTGTATTDTWDGALVAASASTEATHDDWRLPNINELGTLVDRACASPSLNDTVFVGLPDTSTQANYWSSTPVTTNASQAWIVVFSFGIDGVSNKDQNYYIRLVRDAQ